jgi:hypothetical protein
MIRRQFAATLLLFALLVPYALSASNPEPNSPPIRTIPLSALRTRV